MAGSNKKKKKSAAGGPRDEPAGMKRVTGLVKNRGTGFEGKNTCGLAAALVNVPPMLTYPEYFADPPMTADEALEEREQIYHP